MRRYVRIYFKLVAQFFKRFLEYRTDFFIGILSFVFTQAAGIIFIEVVFGSIEYLNSGGVLFEKTWLYLIYGMFQIPRGIDHLFTDNLWLISYYNRRGLLDKYLTRPINVLFHIIAERFQFEALGELIVGTAILAYVLPQLNIVFTPIVVLNLVLFIIMSALIYTSIKLITGSLSFWTKDSQPIMSSVYEVATFTRQPLDIYPAPIKFILVYIIPFAFTSYYPSVYLLNQIDGVNIPMMSLFGDGVYPLLLQCFIWTILLMGISYFIWLQGLKRYESAGS